MKWILLILSLIILVIVVALILRYRQLIPKLGGGGSTKQNNTKQHNTKQNNAKQDSINWDNIKILEELGKGAAGIVYKVDLDGKEYALKREKILSNKIIKSRGNLQFKKQHKYDIELYDFIDTLPADEQKYFIKLYDYRIYKCNYKHKLPEFLNIIFKNDPKFKKWQKEKDDSPYCADYLIELGGKSIKHKLFNMIENKSPNLRKYGRKLAHDVLKACNILRKNNRYHGDAYEGNIVETNKGDFKLIDYGESRKVEAKRQKIKYSVNVDLIGTMFILAGIGGYFWENYLSKLDKLPPFSDFVKFMIKKNAWNDICDKLKYISKYAINKNEIDAVLDKIAQGQKIPEGFVEKIGSTPVLAAIYYPKLFVEYWKQYIANYKEINPLLSYTDLQFMVDNFHDMDKLISHFS